MQLPRFVGFVDLAVITVILVAVVLPPREMYASAAMKAPDAEQFALALAEARAIKHPDDAGAQGDLVRRLSKAGFVDWAIETALDAVSRTEKSPDAWRALIATSIAYVDRLDVRPALDYANKALASCAMAGPACPSWEQVRMKFYQAHLEAGVESGIDPRQDPKGFQQAGQRDIRIIRLGDPTK